MRHPALEIGGELFHLRENRSYVVGSASGADLRLNHPSVEPKHLKLVVVDGAVWVESLIAGPATLVNGVAPGDQSLSPGDRLRIGDLELGFRLFDEAPPPTPAQAEIPEHALRAALRRELRRTPWLLLSLAAHGLLLLIFLWLSPEAQRLVRRTIGLEVAEPSAVGPEATGATPEEPLVAADAAPFVRAAPSDDPSLLPVVPSHDQKRDTFEDLLGEPGSMFDRGEGLLGRLGGDSLGDLMNSGNAALQAGGFKNTVAALRKSGLEIVFVFDSTGSMSNVLQATKERIERMVDALHALVPDARIGVVTYRDKGKDEDYLIRGVPLSRDYYRAINFLNVIRAGGGGDTPEAVLEALQAGLRQDWGKEARRVLVLIGDAPPHKGSESAILQLARTFAGNGRSHLHTIVTKPPASRTPPAEASKQFEAIARAGKGTAAHSGRDDELLRQILTLAFGGEFKSNIDEVYKLVEQRSRSVAPRARDVARHARPEVIVQALRRDPADDEVLKALLREPSRAAVLALIDIAARADSPATSRHAAAFVLQRLLELDDPPVDPERGAPVPASTAHALKKRAQERFD